MYKNDFCCGGYSEHNNCCPHNLNHGCGCGLDACGFLLHATHELEESLDRLRSRISGNENMIAENYEKCSDAIENVSREQQELRNAVEQIIINGGVSGGSELISIPTRLSQLINDSGFVTESRLNSLIHTIVAAGNYITRTEAQQMIQNGGSTSVDIPTKLSQFTNDLGFVTESRLNGLINTAINNANYATESRVIELLQAAGLNSNGTITQQFKNAIDNAGFVTQEELAQALLNAGYTTSSDIQQALQNAGYVTQSDVQRTLNNANYATKSEVQQAIQNASIGGDSANYVTVVKIGNTPYYPSNGVISLPAYPTSGESGSGTGTGDNPGGTTDTTTGRKSVGGYEVVDLGLPSGTLWATCNVGATTESGYGNIYKYGFGSTQYESSSNYYLGNENPLNSSADTATRVMQNGFHMPTREQLQELIDNTNCTSTTINGVAGSKLTSKTNPNAYIFIPLAGRSIDGSQPSPGSYGLIWSSTPDTSENAYSILFNVGVTVPEIYSTPRNYGYSVRGVHSSI